MTKVFGVAFLAGMFVMAGAGVAIAQHGHGGMGGMNMSGQGGMDMSGHGSSSSTQGSSSHMSMKDRPVQSNTVEGYKITLDVMDMNAHMNMQGMKGMTMKGADHEKSHEIMVTVQDTASREIISDAKVSYIILTPSGQKESGKLEWSGDYYGAGFSPKEKGNYQLQFVIESGGMERQAKFSYPRKG